MFKTAIFVAGVACGCVIASAMTDEQRRMLARPARRIADDPATQRIGDSVRHIADNAADLAASKVDGLAEAIRPANGNGDEPSSTPPTMTPSR